MQDTALFFSKLFFASLPQAFQTHHPILRASLIALHHFHRLYPHSLLYRKTHKQILRVTLLSKLVSDCTSSCTLVKHEARAPGWNFVKQKHTVQDCKASSCTCTLRLAWNFQRLIQRNPQKGVWNKLKKSTSSWWDEVSETRWAKHRNIFKHSGSVAVFAKVPEESNSA